MIQVCHDLVIFVMVITLTAVLKEYVKAVLFQVLMLREYSHILQYLMNLEKYGSTEYLQQSIDKIHEVTPASVHLRTYTGGGVESWLRDIHIIQ